MITWLRRRLKASPLIAFYLSFFMVAPIYPAQAAPVYAFSSLSNRCVSAYSASAFGSRYVVARATSISAIMVRMSATAPTTNFSTSRYYIRPDLSGYPGSIAATFTPDTVTGGLARFTGSYSAVAGTKFWVTPGQGFATLNGCYGQPLTSGDITSDGSLTVDSATGISTPYYTESSDNAVTWGIGTQNSFLFQLALEIGADSSTVTISSISPSVSPLVYKNTYTLTATLSAPGKTTFYAQGKTIPGCKNILWATTTATCTWKPVAHGAVSVYATLKPTDTSKPTSVSPTLTYGVSKRSNTR